VTRLIIQIYEIQTPGEAERMAQCGVDHIGSVVCGADRWRKPVLLETLRTAEKAGAASSLILLFQDPDTVFSALSYYQPNIVHFCEDLAPYASGGSSRSGLSGLVDLQQQIRGRFPDIRVMRSIQIPRAGEAEVLPVLEWVRIFEPATDYFLIDTWMGGNSPQPVNGFVGITGRTCDWGIAAGVAASSRIPVILAGGLSPENVCEAIQVVRPAGVDSCTRTNAVDAGGRPIRFQKDGARVRRFVSEARRAEREMQTRPPALNPGA
jgi:phosphoribosylanthranilate isomerase